MFQPTKVISHEVTDQDAKRSCVKFATDQRLLVEPACGAALSAVYTGLVKKMQDKLGEGPLVMVVCGVLMVVGLTARAHGRCFALHPPVSDVLTTTMSTMPSNYSTTLATTQSLTVRLASLVTVFGVCLGELYPAAVLCCRACL